jgi:hypothetical protein
MVYNYMHDKCPAELVVFLGGWLLGCVKEGEYRPVGSIVGALLSLLERFWGGRRLWWLGKERCCVSRAERACIRKRKKSEVKDIRVGKGGGGDRLDYARVE